MPRPGDDLYREACRKRDEGAIGAAIKLFERAAERYPDHLEILSQLASLYDQMQLFPQAQPLYERALAVDPDHVATLLSYGSHSMNPTNVQSYQRAEMLLNRAIKLAPDNSLAQYYLGSYFFRIGQYDKASTQLRTALALDPRSPDVLQHLGATAINCGAFAEAATWYRQSLELNPTAPTVRWQLALVDRQLGKDPASEQESYRLIERAESEADPGCRFRDVAAAAHVARKQAGRASAWFDHDGDGWPDLLTVTSYLPLALYRNLGDGTFADATQEAHLDQVAPAWGSVAADFDNDGDADLFLTRNGWLGAMANSFLRNDAGKFADVTDASGTTDPNCSGFAASAADIDNDGLLDLFVSNISPYDNAPNRLYHNLGGLKFREIAKEASVLQSVPSIGCCFGDYDQDGLPDLYVANFGSDNAMFHNEGALRFKNVTRTMQTGAPLRAFVCFFFEADNDGDLDLFCSGYATFHDFAASAAEGRPSGGSSSMNTLYRNDGDRFTTLVVAAGFKRCYGTMAATVGDLNGDGNLDVFCANGGPEVGRWEPNTAYFGDGKGRFLEAAQAAGLRYVGKSHGVSVCDFDLDGCANLFLPCGGAFLGDLEASHLYVLEGQPEPSITLDLEGVTSNRDAIGAQVLVRREQDRQLHEVTAGLGFGCTNGKEIIAHVPGGRPATLDIRWPSGKRQQFVGVKPGRYHLREDRDILADHPRPQVAKRH